MGLLDKLKNVFFEEEVVDEEIEKTSNIARKIEVPKKNHPVVNVNEDDVSPQVSQDVKMEVKESVDEPTVSKEVVDNRTTANNKFSMMFEEDDFVLEEPKKETVYDRLDRTERKPLYPDKREQSYAESIKKENAHPVYSKSLYENKEAKVFTPSPIISPIYGILDKNYKKEEVVTKKEIRITSTVRNKVDLDTVRNKAFGENEDFTDTKTPPPSELEKPSAYLDNNVKENPPDVKIYDVNKEKPSVKGVTLQDADEYYNDLGLAYNVDYNDKVRDHTAKHQASSNTKSEDNLFDLIESMYDKEE